MADHGICLALLIIVASCSPQVKGAGLAGCGVSDIKVTKQAKTLLSPGYPNSYERVASCNWLLRKDVNASNSYSRYAAVQIAAIDLDIQDTDGECTNDYLEISSGESESRLVVQAQWCGRGPHVFLSQDRLVKLRLVTSARYGGRRFALEYGLVYQPNFACTKTPQRIRVDTVPVFATFAARNDRPMDSCKWRVRSVRPNTNLVFEIYKPSQIKCEVGKFVFTEEEKASSGYRQFEFCSNSQPFSKIYFASDSVTVSLERAMDIAQTFGDKDNLIVKMYHQSKHDKCKNPIEVSDGPVMFSMPGRDNGKSPCRLRLQTRDATRSLRLDVMGVDQEAARCGRQQPYVDVTDDVTAHSVSAECSRGEHPVYRAGNRMLVDQRLAQKVFLRVSSLVPNCNGVISRLTAVPNKVQTSSLPDGDGYINLSHCKAMISAQNPNDSLSINLKWKRPFNRDFLPSSLSTCPGDFLNVYNLGQNGTTLIGSTCHIRNNNIVLEVKTSEDQALVVLDADKTIGGPSVMMDYHAIPSGAGCRQEVVVNNTPAPLWSALYPAAPPLKHKCITTLKAENRNDTIVVSIIESSFARGCMTMLTIYKGQYHENAHNEVVKRLCSSEIGVYRVEGGAASIVTESHMTRGPGGWRGETYTESMATGLVPSLGLLAFIVLLFVDQL